MGQTGRREDRQLLSSYQGVQSVDGGDAGLDELLGVVSGRRVHGQAVDVHTLLRQDVGASVDGTAQSVEDTAQHILGYAQLHGTAQETDLTGIQVDTGGGFEQLYQSVSTVNFQNFTAALLTACQLDFSQFIVGYALNAAYQHKGTGNLFDCPVFFRH